MNIELIFDFLTRLNANNHKEWFDQHRHEYEKIKTELKNFAADMIVDLATLDQSIGLLEPKDCLFRINRDVRFSSNKSPYKTNIGLSFTRGGKKSMYAGYYLHIQPGNESFVAGGLYMPPAEILKKVRDEIDYDSKELSNVIEAKTFVKYFNTLTGDKLSNPPRGYDSTHPQIELLKHKSFLAWHKLEDKSILTMDLQPKIFAIFKAMTPLNNYLNKAIDHKD